MTEPETWAVQERRRLRQQMASEQIHGAELSRGPRWWVRWRVRNTTCYWQEAADRANDRDRDRDDRP